MVASSQPPMPTSSTTKSHLFSLKYKKASATAFSNSDGTSGIFAHAFLTNSAYLTNSSSEIISPFILNCSRYTDITGDVKSPVLYPAALRISAVMAHTEPFPLVPATWINLSFFCGQPSLSSNSSILPRPSLMTPLCDSFIKCSASVYIILFLLILNL